MSSLTSPDVRRNPMAAQNQTIPHRQAGRLGKGLLRLFIQGHVAVYRRTNGKIGGGEHLLLLTTTGRKSGVFRCSRSFSLETESSLLSLLRLPEPRKAPYGG